jgi:hypothetical protein
MSMELILQNSLNVIPSHEAYAIFQSYAIMTSALILIFVPFRVGFKILNMLRNVLIRLGISPLYFIRLFIYVFIFGLCFYRSLFLVQNQKAKSIHP